MFCRSLNTKLIWLNNILYYSKKNIGNNYIKNLININSRCFSNLIYCNMKKQVYKKLKKLRKKIKYNYLINKRLLKPWKKNKVKLKKKLLKKRHYRSCYLKNQFCRKSIAKKNFLQKMLDIHLKYLEWKKENKIFFQVEWGPENHDGKIHFRTKILYSKKNLKFFIQADRVLVERDITLIFDIAYIEKTHRGVCITTIMPYYRGYYKWIYKGVHFSVKYTTPEKMFFLISNVYLLLKNFIKFFW